MPASDTKSKAMTGTALQQINDRLAAMTPDQFTASGQAPEDDYIIVSSATDYQRRLFTLVGQLDDEYNALARTLMSLKKRIDEAISKGSPLKAIRNLVTGGLPKEVLDQYEAGVTELKLRRNLFNTAKHLFWLEVKMANAELADKNQIAIFDDWSLGYRKEPDENEDYVSSEVVDLLQSLLKGVFGGKAPTIHGHSKVSA